MAKQTYNVEGMSCSHCENAVTEELSALNGISNIVASADKGIVVFDNDGSADEQQIVAAIDEAGYDAAKAKSNGLGLNQLAKPS